MTEATTIVGRQAELEALDAFVADTQEHPAVLVLEGEAGSGKTTMWTYAVEAASRAGSMVLAARPSEAETGFAYAALSDLLAPVLSELDDLPPPQRRALELALLVAEADDDPCDEHAIAAAALSSLGILASERPLFVAVDDLQWLDDASRQALAFALRRLHDERVGVLLATRDATSVRGELPPSSQVRTLRPLSFGAIGKIVRDRFGEGVSRTTLRRVHEVADGNAFYALELAAAVKSDSGLAVELAVPPSLQELVRDRTERLTGACLEACLAVALAAHPTEALIHAALGTQAVVELERAAALGILDLAHERLRFTHPLLGSAIASRSSRRRRAELHRVLAGVATDDEQRARHLAAATSAPDEDVARVLADGARRAGQRGAPSAAADLFEEAIRVTPPALRDAALERTIAAADHRFLAGEADRASQLLEELSAATEPGPARARVARRLARVRASRRSWSDATMTLRHALADAGDNAALAGAISNDLAVSLMQYGDLAEAFRHAEAAVQLAERSGERALLEDARVNLMAIEFQRGRADPVAAARVFEALREGEEQRPERLLQRRLFFITWAKYTDRFEDARTAISKLVDELTALGREGVLAPVLFQGAELECWAGNLDAAAPLVQATRASYEETGQPMMDTRALYVEGLLHAIRGDRASARDAGTCGLELAERAGDRRLVIRHLTLLGFTELTHDEPAAAHSYLERADELVRLVGYGEPGMFRKDGDAIEALIRLALLDRARERVVLLESSGRRLRRTWALEVAARCRGLLALAEGRPALAVELLEKGLVRHDSPQPIEHARTLLAYGEALRRDGRRTDARSALEEARDRFARVGAATWENRARAEIGRLGGRVRQDDLTPTERRVAELVSAGKTNKEVAASLFVTDRTVEGHLTHIYAKLGVRSRTELAGRVSKNVSRPG